MTAQRGHPAWLHIEWAIWRLFKWCLLSVSCPPWNRQWMPSFSVLFNPLAPNPHTEPAAKQREHTVLTLAQSFSSVEARSPSHPGWLHSRAWTHYRGSRDGAVGTPRSNGAPSHRLGQPSSSSFLYRFCNPGLMTPSKRDQSSLYHTPHTIFSSWNILGAHFNNLPRWLCNQTSVSQARLQLW